MSANVDEMMYKGETPWHKQGNKVEGSLTAEEAMEEAGLDWEVEKVPMEALSETVHGESVRITVPFHNATVRRDRQEVLGVVGENYEPIQNAQAFEFLDHLVGEREDIEYHTAGALGRGEIVWILLEQTGDRMDLRGTDDEYRNYFLLRTSHDGSHALECMMTPVRVVCENTLNLAVNSGGFGSDGPSRKFKVKHTRTAEVQLEAASNVLRMAGQYFDKMGEIFSRFIEEPYDIDQMERLTEELFPPKEDGDVSPQAQAGRTKCLELFEEGTGITPEIEGTKYAAIQATSEYADHHRTVRASKRYDENDARFRSVIDGTAQRFKQKAFNIVAEQ